MVSSSRRALSATGVAGRGDRENVGECAEQIIGLIPSAGLPVFKLCGALLLDAIAEVQGASRRVHPASAPRLPQCGE